MCRISTLANYRIKKLLKYVTAKKIEAQEDAERPYEG